MRAERIQRLRGKQIRAAEGAAGRRGGAVACTTVVPGADDGAAGGRASADGDGAGVPLRHAGSYRTNGKHARFRLSAAASVKETQRSLGMAMGWVQFGCSVWAPKTEIRT